MRRAFFVFALTIYVIFTILKSGKGVVKMNVTIWNERACEEQRGKQKKAYPDGMQNAIAKIFPADKFNVTISSQNLEDDGLSEELLSKTDVLVYWAHTLHEKLSDDTAQRVLNFVNGGMGAVFLHSSHVSKPFKRIMGTSGSLKWREDGRHERIYTVSPYHPIANGIPESFVLKKEEMYCEYFDIPTPDEIVFIGWYPGGEIFRSGFTYRSGEGRVFYFQPGHETFPIYYNENVKKILYNAVLWAGKEDVPVKETFVKDSCPVAVPKDINISFPLKR